MSPRPAFVVVASAVATLLVGLALHPTSLVASALVTGASNALVWPVVVFRARPDVRAVAAGIACALASGAALARLPESCLSSDRFAGGASIGVATIALPIVAAVATLAALGVASVRSRRGASRTPPSSRRP